MAVDPSTREYKLAAYLNQVSRGKRKVSSIADAKRFLEAITVHRSLSECVERLVASSHGLEAVRTSVRADISSSFINNSLVKFLLYLSDPSLKLLCGGQHLHRILLVLADPPSLIHECVKLTESHLLSEDSCHALAWLLWELLNLPATFSTDPSILSCTKNLTDQRCFLTANKSATRQLVEQLKAFLRLRGVKTSQLSTSVPGGRHDNDFENFREISVLPTGDELASAKPAFYRRSDDVLREQFEDRPAVHLDNQFRLLREDMLGELRLDLQAIQGKLSVKRHIVVVDGLMLSGIHFGDDTKRNYRSLAALRFHCTRDIPRLKIHDNTKDRKRFLREHYSFMKNESYGVLIHEQSSEVLSFATIDCDEDLLSQKPPVLVLQLANSISLKKTLLASKLRNQNNLKFVLLDTPLFAYEPILRRLQEKAEFIMPSELLSDSPSQAVRSSVLDLSYIVSSIEKSKGKSLQHVLGLSKAVDLDLSQTESLIAGLTQSLSLIQGPPGTGKSFIGALLAKAIHDQTQEKILVMCYTNHALDQFLEDLLDIGIPETSIVRLGSKSTTRTLSLQLSKQQSSRRLKHSDWAVIDQHKAQLEADKQTLRGSMSRYFNFKASNQHILPHLEFSEEYHRFFDAFQVEVLSDDDMYIVGSDGKKISNDYLIERWANGQDAGVMKYNMSEQQQEVWKMDKSTRRQVLARWQAAILEEEVATIPDRIQAYNSRVKMLRDVFKQGDNQLLQEKRIVGCTTTGASMFVSQLEATRPGVLIVEEAGEILESHVLAAMSAHTKQVILIGDHKQLRPKINNYSLSVEKGDGHDLNRSMFERLVLGDYPHQRLQSQHRMPAQISEIIRHLTYPDLKDAPEVATRPALKGLQDRVVFLNHERSETELTAIGDRHDQGSKSSNQNDHEVTLVLSCLKYLAQQGYGTDSIVILTPYLGQLFLLKRRLSKENDPVLNDLDSFDLVRAGLMTPASANHSKRPIKISTIDNYQGEESDIVIVSLTRSNSQGDIGFLIAPERLNVLLSRSRLGLIMIGNMATFTQSKRGGNTWKPFLDFLKEKGHLYDGLPVKCERHPDKKALLREKEDFERLCPDGGCSQPCGAVVSCGVHVCESRCHQIFDHSKMLCTKLIDTICPRGHKHKILCQHQKTHACYKCDQEDKEEARRRQRDYELDQRRIQKQRQHAQRLMEIQDEIDHLKRLTQENREDNDRVNAVNQRLQDLERMRENAKLRETQSGQVLTVPSTSSVAPVSAQDTTKTNGSALAAQRTENAEENPSNACKEWRHRKELEGESNQALDDLMQMIGLDNIKQRFLDIKAKIDLWVRQNVDLKEERFNATLLGNPGTGKTTVARLYAKFLTSVGALSGEFIEECTGSGLASDGVPGLLDYLLAEVENQRGKIVFVIAGYSKQMEKFFEHNQGFPSRFPQIMQFEDYKDDELLELLNHTLDKKYKRQMKVEDGSKGLFARIVSRRIGRGRDREGFGNAREVENAVARITDRQAARIKRERRTGRKPDDMQLTQEDLIGPRPSDVLQGNPTWQELQELIGLTAVKESLSALFDSIEQNFQREIDEKSLVQFNLNRVFLGNPGTGKTTVAKLYGKILASMGLLSDGEVVIKTPSDFIGNVLGASESQTKAILASTVGKVLVIDEAYGLHSPSQGTTNIFSSAVVDVIVGEVQSTPGQDRCVLLLGYEKQMETMFQDANPGLARRFPLASAFKFEDFTKDELGRILDLKLRQQDFVVSAHTRSVALDILERSRNRPNFGNAGEVDNLLNDAKIQHQARLSASKAKYDNILQPQDFDADFDRASRADTNIRQLFADVMGCEEIITQLEAYQQTVKNAKARDMDPKELAPFNFLFRGPPGTGKTSTARKMGKIYYDMGFLATAQVEECSATDLIGEYVGHTGPKARKLFEKALGRVLFIDEAYRLAEGQFATEAMDEIVDCLTKPEFHKKLIVVLAGYDEDINRLMAKNPGLTSRFPETITFSGLSPQTCVNILVNHLLKREKHFETAVFEEARSGFCNEILERFRILCATTNWANARDVQTIGKGILSKVLSSPAPSDTKLPLSESVILDQMNVMVSERSRRAEASHARNTIQSPHTHNMRPKPMSVPRLMRSLPVRPSAAVSHETATVKKTESLQDPEQHTADVSLLTETAGASPVSSPELRDPGVDDQVWKELEKAKEAMREQERTYKNMIESESKLREAVRTMERAHRKAEEDAADAETTTQKSSPQEDDEAKRKAEEERIRRELERRAVEQQQREILQRRKKMEEDRRKDHEAQTKLRKLGICPMGYRWLKQQSGYRCAGGSHFVSDAQLNVT